MADLVFSDISKVFPGDVTAVDSFSMTIPDPCMVVLVGPSGCGKTTLLRMVAGLETPTRGTIHLGDQRLDSLQPRDRDVAMVFQSYALYPHMTVRDNLSFGLRLRKVERSVIAERVRETARTLEMEALLDRKPGQLSGGQRQRVALGRAIIREPRVFLFDEPLSNLDARLRTEMRATLKKLYQRLAVTSIYVTHDQVEAMTIGELLVVMNDGRVHQVAPPEVCYDQPADTFVASFLGSPSMNLAGATVEGDSGAVAMDGGGSFRLPASRVRDVESSRGGRVMVGVRPEDILPGPPGDDADRVVRLRGRVVLTEPLGHETLTHIRVGETEFVARGNRQFERDGDGATSLYLDGYRLHLFAGDGGARIAPRSG